MQRDYDHRVDQLERAVGVRKWEPGNLSHADAIESVQNGIKGLKYRLDKAEAQVMEVQADRDGVREFLAGFSRRLDQESVERSRLAQEVEGLKEALSAETVAREDGESETEEAIKRLDGRCDEISHHQMRATTERRPLIIHRPGIQITLPEDVDEEEAGEIVDNLPAIIDMWRMASRVFGSEEVSPGEK